MTVLAMCEDYADLTVGVLRIETPVTHHMAEEAPQELADHLLRLFAASEVRRPRSLDETAG